MVPQASITQSLTSVITVSPKIEKSRDAQYEIICINDSTNFGFYKGKI
jgi:hypothetical protein